ncbi:hypothetical protein RND81_12G088500 [Saponaria officinalis]|uniref:non-specific serine/threonine protein kinase n=1 Tax=Saponaria officinalis TaxID=3572 RepID=A0AAW1H8B0_SAPOF
MGAFIKVEKYFHNLCKISPIFLFHFIIILRHLATARPVDSAQQVGNETDHSALLAIKSRLVGHDAGVLSSWNHSRHHCSWDGVTCGRKHNRVIGLALNSRGFVGSISPFIGNLSFLEDVELYNNSLVGHIPPEFGRLFRLQTLWIYNNTLDGEIPANLSACVNLQQLSIGSNKLEGKLPTELRALSKLKLLAVHANRFSGRLFEVISNITSLEIISASDNGFTGNIATDIGKMLNLDTLIVSRNEFSGTIPTSILNCTILETLFINSNKLHGEVPPDIGLRLSYLKSLELSSNQFSGVFPNSILNLTGIEYLGLDTNNFVGSVPKGFGHFPNLWYLDLSFNNLKSNINFVSNLANSTQLEMLQLSGNEFSGILPESVANFSTHLQILLLGKNNIKGQIPAGITNLINLELLILTENAFIGSIPRDLGKLPKIEWLSLGFNRLTGNIPNSFKNLTYLSKVLLNDNHFQGTIPSSLGSCPSLLYLDMSSNRLNGTLLDALFNGSSKFISLLIHDNLLVGSIPFEIGMQTNLVEFSVSKNKLSGTIPDSFGECSSLQSLDMHNNVLSGYIPPTFRTLGSLQIIDLSENNFSGTIPNYFSEFPLKLLNLSYNDFEGKVPTAGVFANKSAVMLDGNNKLCGGKANLHLRRCMQRKEKKPRRNTSHTLKLTIFIICPLVGLVGIIATWLYLTCQRKKRVPVSSDLMKETLIKVSYDMLLKATNGFASQNLVGAGSFGSVYRGILDGSTVAIKVLKLQTRGASKSFMAECKALRNVRHRNLVGIITACSSIDYQRNDFKALIYEFMANGNLDGRLYGDGDEKPTLLQRVDIAIDVAHALSYLHHDCEIPIVHRDLKPTNILLDDNMVARVGDFGLSKFIVDPQHPNQSSSVGVKGTIGYVAPEYGLGSEPSQDGDLYSYGIVVLELMTGKRPTDHMFQADYSLQLYAEAALPENVLQIIDPVLLDNKISEEVDDIRAIQATEQRRVECMASVINVGVACSKHLPHDRMKISEVINKLQIARDNLCDNK